MKKWLIPLFVAVLVFGSSLTCFASSDTIPPLPADAQYTTYYVIAKINGSYQFYGTNTKDLYYMPSQDALYHNTVKGSIWCEKYKYDSATGSWTKIQTSQDSSSVAYIWYDVAKDGKLVYSSFDICNESTGEVFFSGGGLTLADRILKVGETEILVQMTEILGTMKTLLACGVGCLALLISLPVLSKVFSRFL